MRSIWSFSAMAMLALTGQFSGALAQGMSSSSTVLKLAIAREELVLSENARIVAIDATKFRNGQTQWSFDIRDGEKLYEIRLRGRNDQRMDTEVEPGWSDAAFLTLFPSIDELDTVESYLEKAKAELASAHPELVPRDQYIIEYDICDPPEIGKTSEYETGCRYDEPRETWTIILKSDVSGTDDWVNKAITFHDGRLSEITGARVGGNW